MDFFESLQNWYSSQCDGYWETKYGISITNVGNPGWHIEIDLAETTLEQKKFNFIDYRCGKNDDNIFENNDWFFCRIENKKFIAGSGPLHLLTVIKIFLDWVQK